MNLNGISVRRISGLTIMCGRLYYTIIHPAGKHQIPKYWNGMSLAKYHGQWMATDSMNLEIGSGLRSLADYHIIFASYLHHQLTLPRWNPSHSGVRPSEGSNLLSDSTVHRTHRCSNEYQSMLEQIKHRKFTYSSGSKLCTNLGSLWHAEVNEPAEEHG
jgi:hypothetical protein